MAVLLQFPGVSRADAAWAILGGPQLTVPHYRHTATLLADGRLLVAGGASRDTGTPTAVAEILDLPNGASTWAATGTLRTARYRHTAVLLRNGKVLVVGGQDEYTTELFDPPTGMWSYGPPMSTARAHHTTTLLRDGRVLICGGYSYGGAYLSSVEIYNPATNTIASGPSMGAAHAFHAASLMQDGRVLVVGGFPTGNAAEIYNPATNQWSMTGSMATGRHQHTAALLANGKVLAGGGAGAGPGTTSELFNPATGTWSATGAMVTQHFNAPRNVILPNGKLLMLGANVVNGDSGLYDPVANTWTNAGIEPSPRIYMSAALLPDGRVLAAGGFASGPGYHKQAEVWDPALNMWTLVTPMKRKSWPPTRVVSPGSIRTSFSSW